MADDVFEKLAAGEPMEEPVEDETEEAQAEAEAQPEAEGETPAVPEEDPSAIIAKLTEQVTELEKATGGFRQAMESERAKRQHLEGRLSQVSEIFTKAKESAKAVEEPAKPKIKGLPIEMDEEGNAFVPDSVLDEYLNNKIKPIQSSVTETRANFDNNQQRLAIDKTLNSILSANGTYVNTYSDLNNKFSELVNMTSQALRMTPQAVLNLNSRQLLKATKNSPVKQLFESKNPGVPYKLFLETFAEPDIDLWPDNLTELLDRVTPKAPAIPEEKPEATKPTGMDKSLKALAKKPAGLAGARTGVSSKVSDEPDLDTIANISTKDFMAMSESEVKKIEKLLQRMAEG